MPRDERKERVIQALAEYFIDEVRTVEVGDEHSQAKRIFGLLSGRFYDCIMGMVVLSANGLDTQSRIVGRHALECLCFMGACASLPENWRGIVVQESFQRNILRDKLLKAEAENSEEIKDAKAADDKLLAENADHLGAISEEITNIKTGRGWPKTSTHHPLSLKDLAVCSEDVFGIYSSMFQHLNLYTHVFLPNLVTEHGGVEYEEEPATGIESPMNDALVLVTTAMKEFDRLFGSETYSYSEKNLADDWPDEIGSK